jgi:hypothetical protein
MKRISIFILLLLVSLSFTSCDQAKDALDVNFDTEVTGTMKVVATNNDDNTYTLLLDVTTDSEIQQYASKIKNYEVEELALAVENYSSTSQDDNYFNGNLGFSATADSQPVSTCSFSNLNVKHIAGTGYATYNDCNNLLDQIATTLTEENAAKIYLVGSLTVAPSQFDMLVRVKLKVTANPL